MRHRTPLLTATRGVRRRMPRRRSSWAISQGSSRPRFLAYVERRIRDPCLTPLMDPPATTPGHQRA